MNKNIMDKFDAGQKPSVVVHCGDRREERAVSSQSNGQTWSDFTQNTTIHGVKYIFEKGNKVRR